MPALHWLMLAFLLALALSFQPATRPAADVAEWKEQVMRKAGIDAWPSVTRLEFTFNVELPDGRGISRTHDWNPQTGENRVTSDGETTAVNVYDFDPAAATEAETAAFAAWTNDGYWLLMPLKLADLGVTFGRPQMAEDGLVVTMTFDDIGLTPGDAYDLRVDLQRDVIDQWTYRPNAETSRTFTWDGYEDFNGLYLATEHEPLDGGPRITFTDIEVTRQ